MSLKEDMERELNRDFLMTEQAKELEQQALAQASKELVERQVEAIVSLGKSVEHIDEFIKEVVNILTEIKDIIQSSRSL